MAEVLLNDKYAAEVTAFRASANNFQGSSCSSGDLSLPTVEAYQKRYESIWKIIVWTGALVKADADHMDALAARLKAADASGN